MNTQDAIDRAAARLERVRRPHRDLAAAIHALIQDRYDDPLAGIPVVTTGELLTLLNEDDHEPALAYHPPLPEPPFRPRARTIPRLTAAGLRHGYHLETV